MNPGLRNQAAAAGGNRPPPCRLMNVSMLTSRRCSHLVQGARSAAVAWLEPPPMHYHNRFDLCGASGRGIDRRVSRNALCSGGRTRAARACHSGSKDQPGYGTPAGDHAFGLEEDRRLSPPRTITGCCLAELEPWSVCRIKHRST